jgi:transposase
MSKALSVDLRERVVAAVSGGMSRRAAAERFGVSAASAVRWCQSLRRGGTVAPKALGGDRRSGRVERHAALILGFVEHKSDITLAEIQAELARHGHSFGLSTLCRFFQRHSYTRKKRQRTPPSKTVPTS